MAGSSPPLWCSVRNIRPNSSLHLDRLFLRMIETNWSSMNPRYDPWSGVAGGDIGNKFNPSGVAVPLVATRVLTDEDVNPDLETVVRRMRLALQEHGADTLWRRPGGRWTWGPGRSLSPPARRSGSR
jgi:hypothetical protein